MKISTLVYYFAKIYTAPGLWEECAKGSHLGIRGKRRRICWGHACGLKRAVSLKGGGRDTRVRSRWVAAFADGGGDGFLRFSSRRFLRIRWWAHRKLYHRTSFSSSKRPLSFLLRKRCRRRIRSETFYGQILRTVPSKDSRWNDRIAAFNQQNMAVKYPMTKPSKEDGSDYDDSLGRPFIHLHCGSAFVLKVTCLQTVIILIHSCNQPKFCSARIG